MASIPIDYRRASLLGRRLDQQPEASEDLPKGAFVAVLVDSPSQAGNGLAIETGHLCRRGFERFGKTLRIAEGVAEVFDAVKHVALGPAALVDGIEDRSNGVCGFLVPAEEAG